MSEEAIIIKHMKRSNIESSKPKKLDRLKMEVKRRTGGIASFQSFDLPFNI